MQGKRAIERYFWGVHLAVIGVVAVVAGWTATSLFANAYLGPGRAPGHGPGHGPRSTPFRGPRPSGAVATSNPAGLRASAATVQSRNLFCSSCDKPWKPIPAPGAPPQPPRLDDAVLLATHLAAHDPQWTLAAVRFPGAGHLRILGQGSQVGDAEITRVTATQVQFTRAGRPGVLDLVPGAPKPPAQARRNQARPKPRGCPATIRRLGPGRFAIDCALVTSLVTGLGGTTRDVAVAPLNSAGRLIGLRLLRVRPYSTLHCLGLRAHDQITAINNQSLTSPDILLTLMAQVPTAHHVTVTTTRQGRPHTLDYTIE